MRRIVVVLFLTLIVLAACTSIDCPVQNKVYTNYNLYKSDGSVDTLTVDTLTIVTKVADGTLDTLLNQSTGITYFELDISHTQPEDEFYLFLNDTLGNAYTATPSLSSTPLLSVTQTSIMIQTSNISAFISRLVISLVMLMAASTAHAQLKVFRMEKDSIPLFRGFQVSFDLVGAARLMFGDRGEIGGGLRVNLHDQWFPVVEFGIGKANHNADEPTYIAYKTTAPYFRVGIDINLLKNKHQSNRLYGGILEDPIWGTKSDIVVEGMKCSMHWFEVVFGIDAKIFGPLHLGWDVRYKRRLSHKEGDIGQSWYVPGFGVNDQNNIGLSFNAIIDI